MRLSTQEHPEISMPKQLQDDVRAAFERVIEGGGESPDELLNSVRGLVRALKSEGLPPESVIVTIKDLCGLTHMAVAADTDSSMNYSMSKRISDQVVRTVIEEYYKGARATAHRPWQGYAREIGDELR